MEDLRYSTREKRDALSVRQRPRTIFTQYEDHFSLNAQLFIAHKQTQTEACVALDLGSQSHVYAATTHSDWLTEPSKELVSGLGSVSKYSLTAKLHDNRPVLLSKQTQMNEPYCLNLCAKPQTICGTFITILSVAHPAAATIESKANHHTLLSRPILSSLFTHRAAIPDAWLVNI